MMTNVTPTSFSLTDDITLTHSLYPPSPAATLLSFITLQSKSDARRWTRTLLVCVMSYRMVNMEIEAAEALAGLAYSVSRGVNNDDHRSTERLLSTAVSMLPSSGKDGAPPIVEQHYPNVEASITNGTEGNTKLSKSSVHLSVGKTRQNLNQEEKEARRIRRVMANRESARETIRRRQAHSKDLKEKAASLAWENEDLKKEKELVNQEFDKLKSINESLKVQSLKVQITRRSNNVEETNVEPKSTQSETPASQSACHPPFLYNQPQYFWSPRIQLPDGSQNVFSEQENCVKANGPGIALCVCQCAWFMPRDGPVHLWSSNNLTSSNGPNTSPSTKTIENHNHSLSKKLDTEMSGRMQNERGKNIVIETEQVTPMPGKSKGMERRDNASSKTVHCSPGKKKPSSSSVVINKKKKSEAAAVARKNRKALTKLKFHHGKRV